MINHTYKIATYNIRTDTPADGPEGGKFRWTHRFSYIKKIISFNKWDIIGIQEARQNQLDDLTALPNYDAVGLRRAESADEEYNPILFNIKVFDLINTETFWLSPSGITNSQAVEWGAEYPRIYTVARLKIKNTGQIVFIINTHFDHVSEKARFHSAKILARKINELKSEGTVFLMGDFNGGRTEHWYKIITDVLVDAESKASHQIGPNVTCTMAALDSLPNWEDMAKIDYVFTGQDVEVIQTATLTDKFNGYYPSDHFPLSVLFKLSSP